MQAMMMRSALPAIETLVLRVPSVQRQTGRGEWVTESEREREHVRARERERSGLRVTCHVINVSISSRDVMYMYMYRFRCQFVNSQKNRKFENSKIPQFKPLEIPKFQKFQTCEIRNSKIDWANVQQQQNNEQPAVVLED